MPSAPLTVSPPSKEIPEGAKVFAEETLDETGQLRITNYELRRAAEVAEDSTEVAEDGRKRSEPIREYHFQDPTLICSEYRPLPPKSSAPSAKSSVTSAVTPLIADDE